MLKKRLLAVLLFIGIISALAAAQAFYSNQDDEKASMNESKPPVQNANHSTTRGRTLVATQEAPMSEVRRPAAVIPAGSIVAAIVKTHVSSRDAKVGDVVYATTTEDLIFGGRTIVPAGSEIAGRVTEVQPAAQTRSAAVLRVSFHRIGGLDARLALVSPDLATRARNANRAADAGLVVGGAATGAVIGHQIKHKGGAEKGAIIGAVTGAVAAANFGANVQLKLGEPASLRFTEEVAIW